MLPALGWTQPMLSWRCMAWQDLLASLVVSPAPTWACTRQAARQQLRRIAAGGWAVGLHARLHGPQPPPLHILRMPRMLRCLLLCTCRQGTAHATLQSPACQLTLSCSRPASLSLGPQSGVRLEQPRQAYRHAAPCNQNLALTLIHLRRATSMAYLGVVQERDFGMWAFFDAFSWWVGSVFMLWQ